MPARSFDAVISRVGLIYFPDQHSGARPACAAPCDRAGASAAIVYTHPRPQRVLLDPGRRSSAAAPSSRPPRQASRDRSASASPGVDRGRVRAAGLRRRRGATVDARCACASASECLRFERESFGALHQMLAGLDPAEQDGTWAEIEAALSRFESADGFVGPCEMLVAVGSKQSS